MAMKAVKGQAFRVLHEREGAFIIPNPWDVGTARLLAHLGFEALATTSMGYAFSVGRRDNTIDRNETMVYASAIASATNLPVSADLENDMRKRAAVVGETIRLAAAGLSRLNRRCNRTPGASDLRTRTLSESTPRSQQRVPFPLLLL
jgi:2-methylisocitrate lyase-like PEP mutase family enzyme